ncbi:conserved hypothetical protein [Acidovorax delafieldii 2AN]|uniref:SnoaL-like domain-containing protein n=1 Tax=Acidovorax delafieldii 2AN TaxID=573060 RepID=C5T177_ACIDE|nr:nuclear transport factor 2 family protein [Acidovorax delafieldii]EER61821.1 conserved hypothetical protein [Acidovorax delafieldii 2AN]
MADPSRTLQALADRAAIHDVAMRYFHAADTGNKALVRSCFTEDVRAHYHGRAAVQGADALVAQIALFNHFESGACKIASHFVGNLHFEQLDADTARTETHAIAFLVNPSASGDQVAARSLRYLDRWVCRQGEWKIDTRLHTLDWSAQVSANFATTLAQRVNALPAGFAG